MFYIWHVYCGFSLSQKILKLFLCFRLSQSCVIFVYSLASITSLVNLLIFIAAADISWE